MTMTNTKVRDEELLARIEADADEPAGPAIDAAPLRAIAVAVERRSEAEEALARAVAAAREAGLSWGSIGAVLGVTRQGALKRYGR